MPTPAHHRPARAPAACAAVAPEAANSGPAQLTSGSALSMSHLFSTGTMDRSSSKARKKLATVCACHRGAGGAGAARRRGRASERTGRRKQRSGLVGLHLAAPAAQKQQQRQHQQRQEMRAHLHALAGVHQQQRALAGRQRTRHLQHTRGRRGSARLEQHELQRQCGACAAAPALQGSLALPAPGCPPRTLKLKLTYGVHITTTLIVPVATHILLAPVQPPHSPHSSTPQPHLVAKVDVPWGVDQVQQVISTVAVPVDQRHRLGLHGGRRERRAVQKVHGINLSFHCAGRPVTLCLRLHGAAAAGESREGAKQPARVPWLPPGFPRPRGSPAQAGASHWRPPPPCRPASPCLALTVMPLGVPCHAWPPLPVKL